MDNFKSSLDLEKGVSAAKPKPKAEVNDNHAGINTEKAACRKGLPIQFTVDFKPKRAN